MKEATPFKILVPGHRSMVALLGQRDELLKLIEAAFDSQILVRGNEITISGDQQEAERVAFLFEELLAADLKAGEAVIDGVVNFLAERFTDQSQRRVLRRNADLEVKIQPVEITDETHDLFDRHKQRFKSGVPASIYDFLSMDPAIGPTRGSRQATA